MGLSALAADKLHELPADMRDAVEGWLRDGPDAEFLSLTEPDDDHLLIRADLDDAPEGKIWIWHTGTATTGSNNRLVVQNNGNLVLRTAAGDPVWSSRTGLIRGPLGYTTRASITSTRSGSTDHLTGRVRQLTIGATLVPGAGRAVTLQRAPLRGSWHDYRTKTANSTGYVHFDVAHSPDYLYRLAVAPTRRMAPALSSVVEG